MGQKHGITHCKNGHERTPENLYRGRTCRICMEAKTREWKVAHVADVRRAGREYRNRMTGWTEEMYQTALDKQKRRCAVCDILLTFDKASKTTACKDHDHDAKPPKAREILCNNCNRLLGWIENSGDLVHKLLAYLRKHGKEA